MLSPEVLEAQQALELPAREMLRRHRRGGARVGTAGVSGDNNDVAAAAATQRNIDTNGGDNTNVALAIGDFTQ